MVDRTKVLSSYKTLLKLIQRLPAGKREGALQEARSLAQTRKSESNPETRLAYMKEMAAKIGYLRIITPRQPSDAATEAASYVMRDGKLVPGSGEDKGGRVATGMISSSEAMARNARDFKRLYGADKPKSGGPFF